MLIGYARSAHQNELDQQAQALTALGCEAVYSDLRTGTSVVRPALETALLRASKGDAIAVTRLEVLAHDFRDLMRAVMTLRHQGLDLVSVEEEVDTRDSEDKLLPALAMLAGFELDVRKAREAEAAAQPSLKGRPQAVPEEELAEVLRQIEEGELSVEEAAEELDLDPATLRRQLRRK